MTSRPFDPQWTTDQIPLKTYLEDLCSQMLAGENRKRARRKDVQASFEACTWAIALDLYRAYETDAVLEVGIPSGTTALQDLSNSRYGASFISARTFRDALKCLGDHNLIENSTSFWHDSSGKNNRVARYRATSRLVTALRRAGASLAVLRRHKSAEGIVLKDAQKKRVEYGDIIFANEARTRLREINDMLDSHWVDLALPDDELESWRQRERGEREDEANHPFDFSARSVHRVFNNNDWKQGGRFYGAWWISVPSKLRKHILIDGKRTVEVDFSGLHAAMLYAEAGLTIPDDPYERCLTNANKKPERDLVKRTFNALLNADHINKIGVIDGYSPIITGVDWPEYKNRIVQRYPEFKNHFGSGIGVRLQYKDSLLAEQVMLGFARQGYACLPVHDSFLVHHGLQDDLEEAMNREFQNEFGKNSKVKSEEGIGESVCPSDKPIELDLNNLFDETHGYNARLNQYRELKDDLLGKQLDR